MMTFSLLGNFNSKSLNLKNHVVDMSINQN